MFDRVNVHGFIHATVVHEVSLAIARKIGEVQGHGASDGFLEDTAGPCFQATGEVGAFQGFGWAGLDGEELFHDKATVACYGSKQRTHFVRHELRIIKHRSMSEAINRHRSMVEKFPANEMARFSLGKALFDAGQFTEAREQFVVALQKKPDWMVVQILIGKCDLQAGDKVAARQAFERALQLAISQNHEGPREEMEQMLAELGE